MQWTDCVLRITEGHNEAAKILNAVSMALAKDDFATEDRAVGQ